MNDRITYAIDIPRSTEYLSKYWQTYDRQSGYENYQKVTFINDALYGIGASISDEFKFANGYANFLVALRGFIDEQLDKRNGNNAKAALEGDKDE